MKTPLLFMVFNRPDPTRRVFDEIRKAAPTKLFISADGPRLDRPDDAAKCAEVREIVSHVDWPCEVKTLFRDKNLGCKVGASSAITWFFDNVEEGIVLEDDCLPDPTFFRFCEEMLEHYRDDPKIAMICGYNESGTWDVPYSYFFNKYGHIWGWASWRRAWNQYDITMKHWADKRNQKKIKRAIDDTRMWNYRSWSYEQTFLGRKDTWDYQWELARLLSGQLSVIPSKNMVENLGFGADATHTKQNTSYMILPRQQTSFPLVHNPMLIADKEYDRRLTPPTRTPSMRMRKVRRFIKKLLGIA